MLELAPLLMNSKTVSFHGLFLYPGQVLEPVEQQASVLGFLNERLEETMALLGQQSIPINAVSSSSTPTLYQSHLMPRVTEVRPGTYIFNDVNTLAGGFCSTKDIAATMHCSVVSTAVKGRVDLDAGSKTLSSERCWISGVEGYGRVYGYPGATIVRLSEEHAMVEFEEGSSVPKLGERVRVIPNHICPWLNPHDRVWLLVSSGQLASLPIEARGKVI